MQRLKNILLFFVAIFFILFHFIYFLEANYFTILYWFCHTFTWILHGCTCVRHPEALSHLPTHPIPLHHRSAPAPSTLCPASNLDWRSISHMIIYMFQCHSPKSLNACRWVYLQGKFLEVELLGQRETCIWVLLNFSSKTELSLLRWVGTSEVKPWA